MVMRGDDESCGCLFSYTDLEKRVRADHPLRVIREIANAALAALSSEFPELYSAISRGSIPPERLMRALLLQAFYSIRSQRTAGRVDRLRSAVPLVCRAGHPRIGMGRHGIHEEPRPSAR